MTDTDFDKWILGQAGSSLRIEHLRGDIEEVPLATLLPWLQAAFDAGRESVNHD
jgi:hypothetical protein